MMRENGGYWPSCVAVVFTLHLSKSHDASLQREIYVLRASNFEIFSNFLIPVLNLVCSPQPHFIVVAAALQQMLLFKTAGSE